MWHAPLSHCIFDVVITIVHVTYCRALMVYSLIAELMWTKAEVV